MIAASGAGDSFFGTTSSVTAGRVAFVLGLEGPAMPIDMACASSSAAVHQAVAALERGEVDVALAAGVNAIFSQPIVKFHVELGMLSESGQCNAFDAAADGFVRGEGCGVLVLKRAGEAEENGDRIWGLVRGSALNQNGVSAAIQTPNGPAQERVMQDALDRAGVAPSEVDYLEAHGNRHPPGRRHRTARHRLRLRPGPHPRATAGARFCQGQYRPPGMGLGHGEHHKIGTGTEPESDSGPPQFQQPQS